LIGLASAAVLSHRPIHAHRPGAAITSAVHPGIERPLIDPIRKTDPFREVYRASRGSLRFHAWFSPNRRRFFIKNSWWCGEVSPLVAAISVAILPTHSH
jgi:hypothetical protein